MNRVQGPTQPHLHILYQCTLTVTPVGGLYTELFYPTLFPTFLLICYPYISLHFECFYQPAAREVRSRLVLRLLCCFRVCWYIYMCVHTYHVRNNYVTYIVAMRPSVDFGSLDSCFV